MPEKLFECLSRMDDDAVVNICYKDRTIRNTDTFREMKVSDINDILGHDILEIQKFFDPIDDKYIIFVVIDK